MGKIVLKGCQPYDGEYEIDTTRFSSRDFHKIKQVSGVRAGELDDALKAGDTDVVVALAFIALERNGKTYDPDTIWDADIGSIQLIDDEDDEGADAGPPEPQPGSSGGDSKPTSDAPPNPQSPTGSPPSATGSDSSPETSAT